MAKKRRLPLLVGWKVKLGISHFDDPLEVRVRGYNYDEGFYICSLNDGTEILIAEHDICWAMRKKRFHQEPERKVLRYVKPRAKLRLIKNEA